MKKLTILATILLSIVCIMNSVYAADSFSINAQIGKTEFSKNEEITVEFALSNMQVGDGIISIGATLEYDKDSLEIINRAEQNGWKMTYNDTSRIMLLENEKLIKDNGALFRVTFKVKENSKPNLTIGLKDITAAGAGDEISVANVEKAIVIKSDSSNNGGSGSNNNNNNNGNNNSGNSNNGNGSGNNNSGSGNNNGSSNNGSGNGSGNNNNGGNNGTGNSDNGSNNNGNGNDTTVLGGTTNGNKNNIARLPQTGENHTIVFALIGVATVSAVIFFVRLIMENKAEK